MSLKEIKLKKDFSKFIDGLEQLSKKYNFVIQVTGGISFDINSKIENIQYSRDLFSGDINVINIKYSSPYLK